MYMTLELKEMKWILYMFEQFSLFSIIWSPSTGHNSQRYSSLSLMNAIPSILFCLKFPVKHLHLMMATLSSQISLCMMYKYVVILIGANLWLKVVHRRPAKKLLNLQYVDENVLSPLEPSCLSFEFSLKEIVRK